MRQKGIHVKPVKFYSESFKMMVVNEYEKGFLNKDQLQVKYKIGGNSRVLEWCRKYGKLHYPENSQNMGRAYKDPQKQRIKELEKRLENVQQKLIIYEKVFEVSKKELGIDIIKKHGAKLSKN